MTNALVFNKVIGGISKGAQKKATIVVTYPSGAVCTVSDGSKTYTALDTSGSAAFVVNAGTWTVTAAQDGESKSETVTAAAGSFAAVKLRFWDGTLYDAGNEYTEQTGGWGIVKGSPSIGESSITVSGGANYSINAVATLEKIDLRGYTHLNINMTAVSGGDTIAGNLAVVDADSFDEIVTTSSSGLQAISSAARLETTKTGAHSLDISSVVSDEKSEYYIVYYVGGTTGVVRTRTFDKVWLT